MVLSGAFVDVGENVIAIAVYAVALVGVFSANALFDLLDQVLLSLHGVLVASQISSSVASPVTSASAAAHTA